MPSGGASEGGPSAAVVDGRAGSRWSGADGSVRKAPAAWVAPVATAVTLLLAWEAARLVWGDLRFPPLLSIAGRTVAILQEPRAFAHLAATGVRIVLALSLAFVAGLALGLAMGRARRARGYVASVMHFLQGIPALAWVVFAVLWFRSPELRVAFILVIVTLPGFALHVDGAVRAIPIDWLQLGQAFHADDGRMLRSIVLPAIAPDLLTSWRVNLGNAVRAGVVAELIGTTLGVGYQLLLAQSLFDMAAAVAWTLLLVGMLLILQGVLYAVERRLLGWRPDSERDRGA
jgi:NitT/TauT family transport system permease protein